VKWFRRKKETSEELGLLDIWILMALKAEGLVDRNKIMAIVFLLERAYGLTKTCFVPGRIPWSRDVETALRRLVEIGLIEELPERAYRLTEEGRRAVEKIPMKDPKFRYSYADIKFFTRWDLDSLVEYIRLNYPQYAAVSLCV